MYLTEMVLYEVTAIPDDEVREDYERYMREKHVADVLATGAFVEAHFARNADGAYRATYIAAERSALDRYLESDAPRLRADFAMHFPSGIQLSRDILEVVQAWPAPSR